MILARLLERALAESYRKGYDSYAEVGQVHIDELEREKAELVGTAMRLTAELQESRRAFIWLQTARGYESTQAVLAERIAALAELE